ncbi:MAG: peptide ABC transporter substrate-binding protein [Pyrinomonadaceae bacterium]|nr:peptide ABC transporter substrate-binding protein [Pyrinomonadaceae bacterium]MCX7640537.1 peptide ABC transporter substrate-binding protein [Pyrinomonadaceae bacterium]MDW8303882.1 peptide ABC transporter substrate-binding protein [Acidobacteriota bacterium]
MPKSLDPAKAASPPETDIARAIFKGLTDIDPETLQVIPAVASDWLSSQDYRVWTFRINKNARWTNGEFIKANDFLRSWQRVILLDKKAPHRRLLKNIVGMDPEKALPVFADETDEAKTEKSEFGVRVIDDLTLQIRLYHPDPNFPLLLSHPVFYPVYNAGSEFQENELNSAITTNGPFRIKSIGQDGITLDKNEKYWNNVKLERIKFVPVENEEKALSDYQKGDIDILTNVNFSPTALKLLASYKDFSKTIHGALNFYQFNLSKPPFDNPLVRKALAISINRKSLCEKETEATAEPAYSFLPFSKLKLEEDPQEAKRLLEQAGFADTQNFPTIRLLVNKNDLQRRIALSIAKMWEKELGIKTEVVIKEGKEFELALKNGEFDLVRRGAVFPTPNETSNLMLLFPEHAILTNLNETYETYLDSSSEEIKWLSQEAITTEKEAFEKLPAIPIYFPTAFSLVKPYVKGFTLNAFDIPSIESIWIDTNWR